MALVFHGGGGTPEHMAAMDRGRLLKLARERRFIVVYPEGVGKHWNDQRDDPIYEAHRTNRDDVGFVRALIARIETETIVDRSRVYAAGISNGGFFSYRLACDMPEQLKGIVVVAANLPVAAPSLCRPGRPVSVTVMNGTDDPLVPFEGGEVRAFFRGRGQVLSTGATMEFWAGVGGCTAPTVAELPVVATDDPTRAILHRWDCPSTRLELYEVRGGGHTWPGGVPYLGPRIVGPVSRQIDASLMLADLLTR